MTATEVKESLDALRKQKEVVKKEYNGAMKYLDGMMDNIKAVCPHKYEDGTTAVIGLEDAYCEICSAHITEV